MLTHMFHTPIFFDVADDGGTAPVTEPAVDVEPVVDTTAEVETTDTVVDADAEPTAAEPEVTTPDYGAMVAEWGGEAEVKRAIELNRALQSREGVAALLEEAGKMLYGSDPQKAALLAQLIGQEQAAAEVDPLDEILSDPDRLLTPAEVAQVVDAKVNAALEKVLGEHIQPLEEQRAQEARAQVERSVATALSDLEVPEGAQQSVLSYADRHLTNEDDLHNPSKVKDAIRAGLADWQAEMERQAKVYLTTKKQTVEEHPKTLKSGGAPGGTDAVEPANEDEAISAVRQAILGHA